MTHNSRAQLESANSAMIHASEDQAECQAGPMPAEQDFSLDNWRVAPALNQISHHRLSLQRHLEPRLMKLLCLLASRPGQVISRDELVAALWPRVIVNENSLTRAVSELRKVLQAEDFPARDKLRTIPKRGYRLTATVSTVAETPAQSDNKRFEDNRFAGSPQTLPATPSRLGRLWFRKNQPAIWSNHASQLTAATALSLSLALNLSLGMGDASNDGLPQSQLAQIAPQSGQTATGDSLLRDEIVMDRHSPLTGQIELSASWADEQTGIGLQDLVLAADGDRFAYLEQDLSGSTIYLGQISSEQKPLPIYHSSARLSRLTWSPLGNALLFTRDHNLQTATAFEAPDQQQALYSLNLETLQLRRLIEEDESQSSEAPASNLTFATTKVTQAPA